MYDPAHSRSRRAGFRGIGCHIPERGHGVMVRIFFGLQKILEQGIMRYLAYPEGKFP
jgi:hypothetical protein